MNGLTIAGPSPLGYGPRQWVYVTRRFQSLATSLALPRDTLDDAETKARGVIKSLNRAFRGESTFDNYVLGGSWGKGTAIHPPTDIDLYFILPDEILFQFDAYAGNKQSRLLNYVKGELAKTYSQTDIRQDGQVVVVGFNSITVEVVPSFHRSDRGLTICDTNDGGRWKQVDPEAEKGVLDRSDKALCGNHRKLARIFKQWKRHCHVPVKSFHIERLIGEALPLLNWGRRNEFWFDWIVRDSFAYLAERAGGDFSMPGNPCERISLDDAWGSKAESAYRRAHKACEYERDNRNTCAGIEWRKIFGTAVPETVT